MYFQNIVNMKNSSLLLMAFLLLVGWNCSDSGSSSGTGAAISGKIQNAANLQVYFDQWNFDNSTAVIAKSEIDGEGAFEMVLADGINPAIYRMRIGAKKIFFVFDGSEKKVEINGDLTTVDKYQFEVKGSSAAQQMTNKLAELTNGPIDKEQVKIFAESASNPLAAAMVALNFFRGDGDYLNTYKSIGDRLTKKDPNSKYSKDFATYTQGLEQQILARQASDRIRTGNVAPDIALEDPYGKTFRLSDLKGKVVLLDFWASWCGPCRKSNPHVVETYKKYKDKGFTVFSVSLDGIHPRMLPRLNGDQNKIDQQKEAARNKWIAAIKKDQLLWDTHVSDLLHWNSPIAKTYGVRGIPSTFLIDKEGKIALAGVNPLSPTFNLEAEIKRLL